MGRYKFNNRGTGTIFGLGGKNLKIESYPAIDLWLIGSMSPWVLPERTLGTVRYTETYPGNYLICRTVPCLLSTVPWLSLFRPLLMSQYLKYTCTDRQASYRYKVGLEYETVKPRRNFNLYTLMRAILLQISRWSGMLGWKLGTV